MAGEKTETIVLEGDLVKFVTTEVTSQIRLQDLMPHIETKPPVTVGFLPKTAIYLRWDESQNPASMRVLCELIAGQKTLIYNRRRYTLSVPWTYFLFDLHATGPVDRGANWALSDYRIFWANQKVTSLQSNVGRALIPNCNAYGTICYGNTNQNISTALPLGERLDLIVHQFYSTMFTHDSGAGVPWKSETGSTTWARWERESLNDPMAWQRFPEWTLNQPEDVAIGPMQTVGDLLGSTFQNRSTIVTVVDAIPPIPDQISFGRAEEWLEALQPAQRFRLLTALQNRQADDPAAVAIPLATEPTPGANGREGPDFELGGTPI